MSAAATSASSNVTLTIPARAEYLVCFRLALTGLARAGGIDEETLADLKLAVTEACSNSVRHAYGDEVGSVTARFELGEHHLDVEVEDDGPGFDFPTPDAVDSPPPGLGLSIIQALTEGLRISRGPDGRGSRVSFRRRF